MPRRRFAGFCHKHMKFRKFRLIEKMITNINSSPGGAQIPACSSKVMEASLGESPYLEPHASHRQTFEYFLLLISTCHSPEYQYIDGLVLRKTLSGCRNFVIRKFVMPSRIPSYVFVATFSHRLVEPNRSLMIERRRGVRIEKVERHLRREVVFTTVPRSIVTPNIVFWALENAP